MSQPADSPEKIRAIKELKLICNMYLRLEWAIWDMEEVIKEMCKDFPVGISIGLAKPTAVTPRYPARCVICGTYFGHMYVPTFITGCYFCRPHNVHTMIHWVISKIGLHTGLDQSIIREYMAVAYSELTPEQRESRYEHLRDKSAPKLETLISQLGTATERVPAKVSDLQAEGQVGQDSNK